jgi:hypothetical protein
MFSIGDSVYYVNDRGVNFENLHSVVEITPSKIILQTDFNGKNSLRFFQIHVNRHTADQTLFAELEKAREFSQKRIALISSGAFPFSVGDRIAWDNLKHKGVISEIIHKSYIVHTPSRVWSIDPYVLDVVKLD